MAQSIKYLLHKHQDLSFDPHAKKQVQQLTSVIPRSGERWG